jgi:hypothetical protein
MGWSGTAGAKQSFAAIGVSKQELGNQNKEVLMKKSLFSLQ